MQFLALYDVRLRETRFDDWMENVHPEKKYEREEWNEVGEIARRMPAAAGKQINAARRGER
jgi:hypothetical protein